MSKKSSEYRKMSFLAIFIGFSIATLIIALMHWLVPVLVSPIWLTVILYLLLAIVIVWTIRSDLDPRTPKRGLLGLMGAMLYIICIISSALLTPLSTSILFTTSFFAIIISAFYYLITIHGV